MSAKGHTAVPPGYTGHGKKLHKPKPNPPIELPDGDTVQPVAVLAKKFGIDSAQLQEAGRSADAEAAGAATSATKRPVHPIANLFPMMTDEELANLAADIKANGLISPIVVDKDGVLIDGRNRDRACEIAGIEPETVLFEGDDPRAYIIRSNISRRHLTKGQQAMAVAMIYPVPEKGGRGKRKTMDETSTLFSPKRLQLARTVLAHSSDLAQAVLAGSKLLDAAYDEARKAKQLLDARVAGNVRRKVTRSKKVAVLRGIVGTSHEIITPHSACDPEAPKMSDGTEGIELPMQDLDRLARFKRRTVDPEAVWVCEQLELAWDALRGQTIASRRSGGH